MKKRIISGFAILLAFTPLLGQSAESSSGIFTSDYLMVLIIAIVLGLFCWIFFQWLSFFIPKSHPEGEENRIVTEESDLGLSDTGARKIRLPNLLPTNWSERLATRVRRKRKQVNGGLGRIAKRKHTEGE